MYHSPGRVRVKIMAISTFHLGSVLTPPCYSTRLCITGGYPLSSGWGYCGSTMEKFQHYFKSLENFERLFIFLKPIPSMNRIRMQMLAEAFSVQLQYQKVLTKYQTLSGNCLVCDCYNRVLPCYNPVITEF